MFKLKSSSKAWGTDSFNVVLKDEIGSLGPNELPLQQGLSHSSYANSDNLSASILSVESNKYCIFIKSGLFYTGIITGCNCADDPTPVDEINEYCEVILRIDKRTGETTVSLIT